LPTFARTSNPESDFGVIRAVFEFWMVLALKCTEEKLSLWSGRAGLEKVPWDVLFFSSIPQRQGV
jgi:hypothetical protein